HLCQKIQNTAHHIDFVKKFAELNETGHIIHTTFAPSFNVYLKEIERIKLIQESRVWYNWHNLLEFYLLYEDKESFVQEKSCNNFFYAFALKKEYEKFISESDETRDTSRLNMQTYKRNLFVLWNFMKPYMNQSKNVVHL